MAFQCLGECSGAARRSGCCPGVFRTPCNGRTAWLLRVVGARCQCLPAPWLPEPCASTLDAYYRKGELYLASQACDNPEPRPPTYGTECGNLLKLPGQ